MTQPNLKVIAWELHVAAIEQDYVSQQINHADAAVRGVGENVAKTHGFICSVTSEAVKAAEKERHEAGRNMGQVATVLSGKLDHAAKKYEEIDRLYHGELNDTMHPH